MAAAEHRAGDPADVRATLRREARLARLDLGAEREERLTDDLARVLAAFESLQAVEVADTEPLHQPLVGDGLERDTRERPPSAAAALDREELLARAPRPEDGCFGVPRTIDP